MGRRKGSKNHHAPFYAFDTIQKKSLSLSESIDKFIIVAGSNPAFNKLVDFNLLHKVKENLKELSTDKFKP